MKVELAAVLRHVYFVTHGVKLIIDTIDSNIATVPDFEMPIYAIERKLSYNKSTGDIDDMLLEFSTEIQRDLDMLKGSIVKYGIYFRAFGSNYVSYAKVYQ